MSQKKTRQKLTPGKNRLQICVRDGEGKYSLDGEFDPVHVFAVWLCATSKTEDCEEDPDPNSARADMKRALMAYRAAVAKLHHAEYDQGGPF